MKVYLKYRNYKPIHANFQELAENPPVGVEYVIEPVNKNINLFYYIYRRFGKLSVTRKLYALLKPFLFNGNKDNLREYDLVHIIDHIPQGYETYKYVVDLGHVNALLGYYSLTEKNARQVIEFLAHPNCKAVLARSIAAKKSIANNLKDFCNHTELAEITDKTDVVYPATKLYGDKHRHKSKYLRLLLVGNGIYNKGIHEAIEAYLQVKKVHPNITFTVVASDYEELDSKYLNSGVKFHGGGLSRKEAIAEFFSSHDVFILPTHHEIFGMVFLDAFSTAMPAIAINQYSTPEIIKDGVNGFLVNSKKVPFNEYINLDKKDVKISKFVHPEDQVVEELVERIKFFCENPSEIQRLGKNAQRLVTSGKFSIKTRNTQLKHIYEKAIR